MKGSFLFVNCHSGKRILTLKTRAISCLAHSFSFSTQTRHPSIAARTSAMNASRWVGRDIDAFVYHPVRSEQGAEADDDARPEV